MLARAVSWAGPCTAAEIQPAGDRRPGSSSGRLGMTPGPVREIFRGERAGDGHSRASLGKPAVMKIIRSSAYTFLLGLLARPPIVVDLSLDGGAFSREFLARFNARIYAAEPVPELYRGAVHHPLLKVLLVALREGMGARGFASPTVGGRVQA